MRRTDLADLTAFVAVADNLSFREAASRIGVTPNRPPRKAILFLPELEVRIQFPPGRESIANLTPADAGRDSDPLPRTVDH